MSPLYAYCGLDCMTCPAYTATQANDLDAKQRLLEQWRVEYNSPEMDLSAVTCDGCISKARLGGYCGACPVRACGVERGVLNCAYCPDYGCEKLEGFFTAAPQVRSQLEALRAQIKAN